MGQCPFCDKNCVYFDIKLDAEIPIWMQFRFDGFDLSATMLTILNVESLDLSYSGAFGDISD